MNYRSLNALSIDRNNSMTIPTLYSNSIYWIRIIFNTVYCLIFSLILLIIVYCIINFIWCLIVMLIRADNSEKKYKKKSTYNMVGISSNNVYSVVLQPRILKSLMTEDIEYNTMDQTYFKLYSWKIYRYD